MAAALGVGQPAVAKLEARSDILLSALQAYMRAVGGRYDRSFGRLAWFPINSGSLGNARLTLLEDRNLPRLPGRVVPQDIEVVLRGSDLHVEVTFSRPRVDDLCHLVLASTEAEANGDELRLSPAVLDPQLTSLSGLECNRSAESGRDRRPQSTWSSVTFRK